MLHGKKFRKVFFDALSVSKNGLPETLNASGALKCVKINVNETSLCYR